MYWLLLDFVVVLPKMAGLQEQVGAVTMYASGSRRRETQSVGRAGELFLGISYLRLMILDCSNGLIGLYVCGCL